MSKEGPSFEYYQQFVTDAISSGAHFREDVSPKAQRVWDETVDTIVVSAFSDIYVSELKEDHGVTRTDVALRRRRGVDRLFNAMPDEFKKNYDPDLIQQSYSKRPYTSEMSQHRSRRRGGKAAEAMDYLQAHPEVSVTEVVEHFGYKGSVREGVLRKLKRWGRQDMPEHTVLHTPDMLEEIARAKTYKDRQSVMDRVTKSFMEKNIRGDNSILIALIAEIRNLGFRVHYRYGGSEVYFEALRGGEVAFGTLTLNVNCQNQKYTFAFREDLGKIEKILSDNPVTAGLRINNSK